MLEEEDARRKMLEEDRLFRMDEAEKEEERELIKLVEGRPRLAWNTGSEIVYGQAPLLPYVGVSPPHQTAVAESFSFRTGTKGRTRTSLGPT